MTLICILGMSDIRQIRSGCMDQIECARLVSNSMSFGMQRWELMGGRGAHRPVLSQVRWPLVGAFDCREIFGAVTGRGLPGIGYLSHSFGGRRGPRPPQCIARCTALIAKRCDILYRRKQCAWRCCA